MPRSLQSPPLSIELPPFLNPTSPDFLRLRPARRPVTLSRNAQRALLKFSSYEFAHSSEYDIYLRQTKLKPGTFEVGIRNRVMGRLTLPVSLKPDSKRTPKFRPARAIQRKAPHFVMYLEYLGQHLSGERNWAHTNYLDIEDFVREHDKHTWSD
jgi:hypothetical protein